MDTNPRADRAQITEKVPSFERFFEQEHVLTDRILDCATAIVERLRIAKSALASRTMSCCRRIVMTIWEWPSRTHSRRKSPRSPVMGTASPTS
jgi:hypothetical protein